MIEERKKKTENLKCLFTILQKNNISQKCVIYTKIFFLLFFTFQQQQQHFYNTNINFHTHKQCQTHTKCQIHFIFVLDHNWHNSTSINPVTGNATLYLWYDLCHNHIGFKNVMKKK